MGDLLLTLSLQWHKLFHGTLKRLTPRKLILTRLIFAWINFCKNSFSKEFKEQSENQNLSDSPDKILRHLKLKNMNRLAIDHLNINSLRNKFDTLRLFAKNIIAMC